MILTGIKFKKERSLLYIMYQNSGCEKKEAHINWSMVIPEKVAPVTGTTLETIGPVPADSRRQ